MANKSTQLAYDSVCRVAVNSDLAKSLNTLRTVPGAPNPFVASQNRSTSSSNSQSPKNGSGNGTQSK